MGSVSWRKRGNRYLVSWRLDDGSQGGRTVDTPDEARDLAAEKRLEMRRGTWRERRSGRLSFSQWADDWWEVWAADPDRSPTTLAATENRLRRHVRPWFSDRPIERISPADIRRWQAQLAAMVGRESLLACRSILHRILQFAEDEGAIASNPVRKVPPPKRRADPEQLLGEARRRAYTPEEAGQLLGRIPLSWWDHVLVFLGTGLRFGELAGLRCHRVRLDRSAPVLQVVEVRYQPGRQPVRQRLQRPPQERRRHPGATARPAGSRVHPPATPTRRRPGGPCLHRPGRRQRGPRRLADDAVPVQLPPRLPARGRPRRP
jgi:hypothetical protein